MHQNARAEEAASTLTAQLSCHFSPAFDALILIYISLSKVSNAATEEGRIDQVGDLNIRWEAEMLKRQGTAIFLHRLLTEKFMLLWNAQNS